MDAVVSSLADALPLWARFIFAVCIIQPPQKSSVWPPIGVEAGHPFPAGVVVASALLIIATISATLQLRAQADRKRSILLILIQLCATLLCCIAAYYLESSGDTDTRMAVAGPYSYVMLGEVTRQAFWGTVVTIGAGLVIWFSKSERVTFGAKLLNFVFTLLTCAAWLCFIVLLFYCGL